MKEAINSGFENIQKKGSRIVAEGKHMLGAAALMRATGKQSRTPSVVIMARSSAARNG